MKGKTLKALDEATMEQLEKVRSLPDGDEKTQAIENLTAIHGLKMDEVHAFTDVLKQIAINGVQIGITVGGWIFYKSVLKDEQHFEINNSPRTQTFRNLLSRMFPRF